MGKTNRIYLKFEDLDWDDDQAIDDFAAALHGALLDRLHVAKEFRSQERDEKEGDWLMKVLYIDMDNVLVDFKSGINRLDEPTKELFADRLDEVPGIFSLMDPMPGAIAAYRELSSKYDTYILSTAPWLNVSAWSDKIQWVQEHLGSQEGEPAYKRLILSHHKNLNMGDYLIDDRTANGVEKFAGEHIHFGKSDFPDWAAVLDYLP